MSLKVGLLIFFTSILVFFLDDFVHLIKKIRSIPILKLLLPLALASLFVEWFEESHLGFLLGYQTLLHDGVYFLSKFSPVEKGAVSLVHVVYLVLLAMLPVLCFFVKTKLQKKHRLSSPVFTNYLGLALWIIGVILISVPT